MIRRTAPIPQPCKVHFERGIRHPDLWLWDSWVSRSVTGELFLYCLALSRVGFDRSPILPAARNDHSFHIRQFTSGDGGVTWIDRGVLLEPGNASDGADSFNVWSGSVFQAEADTAWFAYTGIRDVSLDQPFLQSICLIRSAGIDQFKDGRTFTVSCPIRDYDEITEKGYYLGPRDRLGHSAGEDGGPIMAWRDPYLVYDKDGQLNVFWSAKIGPAVPAIARCIVREGEGGTVSAELMSPIHIPDAEEYSQAEVPKLHFDAGINRWLLLISACNRMHESQPEDEVHMQQRLYLAETLEGPWRPFSKAGSKLAGLDEMFGSSVLSHNLLANEISVLGPYTERASDGLQLSFPEIRQLDLPQLDIPTEGAV